MELIRHISDLRSRYHDCVATIGNFDGFHLGHQAVLKQLRSRADELNLPATVLVFEPQPREFFDPDNAPSRLSRWREKYTYFRAHDIDRMICLRFDSRMASISAQDFVLDLLLKKIGVKYLVIGDDFHFGKGREGDYHLLSDLSVSHDYKVERSDTFLIDGERVSSTRIRKALKVDDFELATRLLGKPYSINGKVIHGEKKGRLLGFPTANIKLDHSRNALKGIYVANVFLKDGKPRPAVAYIGRKPTLDGTQNLLEAHLFDYSGDLYGEYIKVEFLQKLRDDKKFDSFELLKEQIANDARMARDYFLDNE